MAKEDLIPFNELTEEEQKKLAKAGGVKSVQVRRNKKKLKELANMLLDNDVNNPEIKKKLKENGLDTSNKSLALLKLFQVALDGKFGDSTKLKGIEMLMKYAGEDEVTEITTSTPKIEVNIVDNSNLEKDLYDGEEHENWKKLW